ncbi:hypothetical protein M758_10G131900 [Ceratodon purpureus]|nr:hypothetical protein M758_10G131900 [Ceratodon purpureus]
MYPKTILLYSLPIPAKNALNSTKSPFQKLTQLTAFPMFNHTHFKAKFAVRRCHTQNTSDILTHDSEIAISTCRGLSRQEIQKLCLKPRNHSLKLQRRTSFHLNFSAHCSISTILTIHVTVNITSPFAMTLPMT